MKDSWRSDLGLLVLRLGIGLIALYFGSQKLFGVFDGAGIHGTVEGMEKGLGIPPVFALLAIAGEFAGGLGIVFGLLTPVAAFGFACVMAVATVENWKSPGFAQALFTHPAQTDPPKAFFSIALLVGSLAVMLMGPGAFSLDIKLFGKMKKKAKK